MCKHTREEKCKQVGRRTKHNLAEKTNMSINVQLDVSIRYTLYNFQHYTHSKNDFTAPL